MIFDKPLHVLLDNYVFNIAQSVTTISIMIS